MNEDGCAVKVSRLGRSPDKAVIDVTLDYSSILVHKLVKLTEMRVSVRESEACTAHR